mgnify:CR=1 FL=1
MPILILTCKKGIGYKTPYKNRALILKNYLVLFGSYIILHFSPFVNPEPPKNSKFTLKNALQYGIIKASEGGDYMAERGSNDKSKGANIGRPPLTKDDIPQVFYRHYPAYNSRQLNVSELARVCDMSRTTVYKYLEVLES